MSQFFMIQVDGAVPRSPMPPVRIGAVIGQYRLAQERRRSASVVTSSRADKAPWPTRMATRLPEFKISAAVRNCSTGGVGNGGLQEDDVRTLGLRIERLSAASFIICTSFETVRWAMPRSESAIRQARLPIRHAPVQ